MPNVVIPSTGWAEKKLTLMKFEYLTKNVVGKTDMARMVYKRGKVEVFLNNIINAKILTRLIPWMDLGNPIDGGSVHLNIAIRQHIFDEDNPVFVEYFPLF